MKVRLERNRKNPMVLKKNDYFSALMHDPLSLDIRLEQVDTKWIPSKNTGLLPSNHNFYFLFSEEKESRNLCQLLLPPHCCVLTACGLEVLYNMSSTTYFFPPLI